MPTTFWTLTDPETLDAYTFEANPTDVGANARDKPFAYEFRDRAGTTVMLETAVGPDVREMSITTLNAAFYETLVGWFDVDSPVELTDHLGRQFLVVFEELAAPRKRATNFDMVHDLRVRYWVLEELGVSVSAAVHAYLPNTNVTLYAPTVTVP